MLSKSLPQGSLEPRAMLPDNLKTLFRAIVYCNAQELPQFYYNSTQSLHLLLYHPPTPTITTNPNPKTDTFHLLSLLPWIEMQQFFQLFMHLNLLGKTLQSYDIQRSLANARADHALTLLVVDQILKVLLQPSRDVIYRQARPVTLEKGLEDLRRGLGVLLTEGGEKFLAFLGLAHEGRLFWSEDAVIFDVLLVHLPGCPITQPQFMLDLSHLKAQVQQFFSLLANLEVPLPFLLLRRAQSRREARAIAPRRVFLQIQAICLRTALFFLGEVGTGRLRSNLRLIDNFDLLNVDLFFLHEVIFRHDGIAGNSVGGKYDLNRRMHPGRHSHVNLRKSINPKGLGMLVILEQVNKQVLDGWQYSLDGCWHLGQSQLIKLILIIGGEEEADSLRVQLTLEIEALGIASELLAVVGVHESLFSSKYEQYRAQILFKGKKWHSETYKIEYYATHEPIKLRAWKGKDTLGDLWSWV